MTTAIIIGVVIMLLLWLFGGSNQNHHPQGPVYIITPQSGPFYQPPPPYYAPNYGGCFIWILAALITIALLTNANRGEEPPDNNVDRAKQKKHNRIEEPAQAPPKTSEDNPPAWVYPSNLKTTPPT